MFGPLLSLPLVLEHSIFRVLYHPLNDPTVQVIFNLTDLLLVKLSPYLSYIDITTISREPLTFLRRGLRR